jgi:hypothetical protein
MVGTIVAILAAYVRKAEIERTSLLSPQPAEIDHANAVERAPAEP